MSKEKNTAAQRAEEIKKLRNGRNPWDGTRSRFPNIPPRTEFHQAWVNDEKGKVEHKLSVGWEFRKAAGYVDENIDLEKEPNKRIAVRVGTKEDGSALNAYLMEIPETVYQEDLEKKREVNKRRMAQINGEDLKDSGLKGGNSKGEMKVSSNFKPD